MRVILVRFFVLFAAVVFTTTAVQGEENDYLSKIEELCKKDTPQGYPELVKYLKSLTKEQLWTALRQYCKSVEAKLPFDEMNWSPVIPTHILMFYAEPLKRSDISDDEYDRIIKRGDADELEAGLIPGRFTDESFGKLITVLSDPKEGAYFRWILACLLSGDEDFFPALSKTQEDRFFETCLAVSGDRNSPNIVRRVCLDTLGGVFRREYRFIIYDDTVLKELMGAGSREEERKANSLLYSGKINLTSKTIEKLKPWRERIFDFRKKLMALLADEQEPEMIKKEAKRQLHWLDRLPLINSNTTTSVLHGQEGFANEAVVKGLMSGDRSVRKTAVQQAKQLSKNELIALAQNAVDNEKLRQSGVICFCCGKVFVIIFGG